MGKYRKIPISPHKPPVTFFLGMEITSNLQEMCKTKFGSLKNRRGPSARANFSLFSFLWLGGGGNFTAPIRNRVKTV